MITPGDITKEMLERADDELRANGEPTGEAGGELRIERVRK
jgi:hypothetical protein